MAMMDPSTSSTEFPELEIFESLLIAIVFGLSLEKGISWVLMEVQTFPNSSSITADMHAAVVGSRRKETSQEYRIIIHRNYSVMLFTGTFNFK